MTCNRTVRLFLPIMFSCVALFACIPEHTTEVEEKPSETPATPMDVVTETEADAIPVARHDKCDNDIACKPGTALHAFRQEMDRTVDSSRFGSTAFDLALAVADAAGDRVTIRDTSRGIGLEGATNDFKPYQSLMEYTLEPDRFGGICGDLQYFAAHAFAAYGFQTRYVSMFQNYDYREGATNSHASNEVFVDGKWVAIDLTFGFYFEDRLSWSEARDKMLAGETVNRIDIDGGRQSIDTYYVPLEQLVPYMIIEGCPEDGESCILSPDGEWDGVIDLTEGDEPFNWADAMIGWRAALLRFWSAPVSK